MHSPFHINEVILRLQTLLFGLVFLRLICKHCRSHFDLQEGNKMMFIIIQSISEGWEGKNTFRVRLKAL